MSYVDFSDGEPVDPSTSKTAAVDIITNAVDITQCPGSCFRPVGLAWDSKGRLFFSSDQTGEIYMVVRKDGTPVNAVKGASSSGSSNSSSTKKSASSGRIGEGSLTFFNAFVKFVAIVVCLI